MLLGMAEWVQVGGEGLPAVEVEAAFVQVGVRQDRCGEYPGAELEEHQLAE